MERLKRVRRLLLPMPLAVTLLLAPGCGGESGDPMKASDGTPRKTPSEILKEAQAKNATLKGPTTAPQHGGTPQDIQREAQAKNAARSATKKPN